MKRMKRRRQTQAMTEEQKYVVPCSCHSGGSVREEEVR
jgi:hypothetical protein